MARLPASRPIDTVAVAEAAAAACAAVAALGQVGDNRTLGDGHGAGRIIDCSPFGTAAVAAVAPTAAVLPNARTIGSN